MMDEKLRPFQRRFVKAIESSSYDTVALCGPRGLGKTFLAGHVLARALTPGDKLNQPGAEYVLEIWPETPILLKLLFSWRRLPPCNDGVLKRIAYTITPYTTVIRLLGVVQNPANGFARPLGAAWLDQARMTYAFVRAALEPTGEYRASMFKPPIVI